MFQPNQRMRFSVPQNEFHNRLPVVDNNCRIPYQTQPNTNSPQNFSPTTQHHPVTVMGVGRQTVLGPPQDLPCMSAPPPPHFMGAPPPQFMGPPRPTMREPPQTFIPPSTQQTQILGTPNSIRPPPNRPHHMPRPQLQQTNHFPPVPLDFQGPEAPRFVESPNMNNEFSASSKHGKQTFEFQHGHGNTQDQSNFMGPPFQAPNTERMNFHMDMLEPNNRKFEDHVRPEDEMADMNRDFDDEPKSTFDKYRREKDQFWVENWLKKIGKLKPSIISSLQKKSSDGGQQQHKIHEVQQAFHQSILFLAKLQYQCRSLESMATSVDPQIWEAEKNLTEEYKDKCMELHQYLNDDELLRQIKFKMESRKKKRARLKKQRKKFNEELQATKEHREHVHQQLEEWRGKMAQLAEDEKQKVELKKSADSTLSSVRKKISDAKRTQEFLKAIQKLRKVRRSAAINQGRYSSDVYDQNFEKKMDELTKLMTKQQAVYETEEKTLKVMLEAVEEETLERDKEIKRQKERAKERLEKKLTREKLFGKNPDLSEDDELHPFNMFYRQAEHSVDALVQIRHEWDLHLVPPNIPGSSRIPDGHIIPAEPTSDVWATALKL